MCLRSETRLLLGWRVFSLLAVEERGTELLEAALVFPMLLTLLIGVFWLGRAYNVYETLNRAAREGARVAVSPNCGGCSSANTYPSNSDITTAVNNALKAASLKSCGSSVPGTGGRIVSCTMPTPPSNSCGPSSAVTVQVRYPFKFVVPFTSLNASIRTFAAAVTMCKE